MRKRVVLGLTILHLAVISSFLLPISAVAYAPGVVPGNYVKFGFLSDSYSSTDPSLQTKPQFLKDIDNTAFFRADVLTVSGTLVDYRMTRNFNNNTAQSVMTLAEDVATGSGNATSGGFHYVFIAGGLGSGDKVSSSATAPTVGQIVTRTYAGASRDTNLYTSTGVIRQGYSLTSSEYWDRVSGVLTELSFSATITSGTQGQYVTTYTDLLTVTETNIWSGDTLGLTPLLSYSIVGAIVALVAAVGAFVAIRIRKSKADEEVESPTVNPM